jgi:hypothetical protein
MTIPSAIELSGDLVAAATTLAGLVLVFLGATYTSYQSYAPILRDRTVRDRFRRRAWFVFTGFALSLVAAFSALIGKWFHHEYFALAALLLFAVALLWVLMAAVLSVKGHSVMALGGRRWRRSPHRGAHRPVALSEIEESAAGRRGRRILRLGVLGSADAAGGLPFVFSSFNPWILCFWCCRCRDF